MYHVTCPSDKIFNFLIKYLSTKDHWPCAPPMLAPATTWPRPCLDAVPCSTPWSQTVTRKCSCVREVSLGRAWRWAWTFLPRIVNVRMVSFDDKIRKENSEKSSKIFHEESNWKWIHLHNNVYLMILCLTFIVLRSLNWNHMNDQHRQIHFDKLIIKKNIHMYD